MDYAYSAEWSESQTAPMKGWLTEIWKRMDGEEPDQDFLEYILVSLPSAERKMQEIHVDISHMFINYISLC